jgi:uncharacterized protein (TIGR03437 family)
VNRVGGGGARPHAATQLIEPLDVAAAPAGVLILEKGVNSVSLMDPQGNLTTVAGNRTIATRLGSILQLRATSVPLGNPSAIAADTAGDLNIADGPTIFHISSSGVVSNSTLAGFGSVVNHFFVDPAGNFVLTDSGSGALRKVGRDGTISTIGTVGKFNAPAGVAEDKTGAFYVVESGSQLVRRIDANGGVSTLAGSGKTGFAGDGGAALQAQFNFGTASGMVADSVGALYVADTDNHSVRRIAPGGLITTVAGNGAEGYAGDGGPAEKAQLSTPAGVSLDGAGNLYIADFGNNRVRKVTGLKFPSTLVVNPSRTNVSLVAGGVAGPQMSQILSSAASVSFQAASGAAWLKLDTTSGSTPGIIAWHVDAATLLPGVYTGNINISAGSVENSPLAVAVNLTVSGPPPQFSPAALVNAASLTGGSVAPSENVLLTGSGFVGTGQPVVLLRDSTGTNLPVAAQASTSQIQFQVPSTAALGPATLTITRDDGGSANAVVSVDAFAPGLYSAAGNGRGAALAEVVSVAPDGTQASFPAYQCDATGNCSAVPIDPGDGSEDMLLVLHGTGIRNAGFVGAQIGGVDVETVSYTPSLIMSGVDDVTLRLNRQLVGLGEVPVVMMVGNKPANLVTVNVGGAAMDQHRMDPF